MHRRPTRRREGTQTAHNRRGKQGPEHAPGNVLAAQPGGGRPSRKLRASSWGLGGALPRPAPQPRPKQKQGNPQGRPKSPAGVGGEKGRDARARERLHPGETPHALLQSKNGGAANTDAGRLAPRGREGRDAGGAGRNLSPLIPTPPSGRVVASQTARASGVTWHGGGCRLRTWGSAGRAVGRNRGDVFQLGGWASGKKKKRRNRLMLCRTPRVFLSGAITSTFRQEQELGGKQRRA